MRFNEETVGYFRTVGVSGITDKHYKIRLTKNYTYGLVRVEAIKKDLKLTFYARPTFTKGNKSTPKGDLSPANQYDLEILFVNADKYASAFDVSLYEMSDLSKKELEKLWQKIVNNCDLKFYSNDPSFYWQGFWEDLDSCGASIKPFSGTKGDGTWRKRHNDSGGLVDEKLRITKHLTQVLLDLDDYKSNILKYIQRYL